MSHVISLTKNKWMLLYVINRIGNIVVCFLRIVHISDISASLLKMAMETLFSKLGLSISRVHGQGYDGAQQLQLTPIAIMKKHCRH